MKLKKGFLVVFEGIDGAGKTTKANLLYNALQEKGFSVVKSKEPTDESVYGKKIRKLAMGDRNLNDPKTEFELFLNDRRLHVENLIKPALEQNQIVILDRYYFSNIAYQGALGLDQVMIKSSNESFAPVPEFVFLIEVPPQLGLRRIQNNRGETPNLFEQLDSLTKVDEVYKSLNENYILRLDGSEKKVEIHNHVMNAMEDLVEYFIEKNEQDISSKDIDGSKKTSFAK